MPVGLTLRSVLYWEEELHSQPDEIQNHQSHPPGTRSFALVRNDLRMNLTDLLRKVIIWLADGDSEARRARACKITL